MTYTVRLEPKEEKLLADTARRFAAKRSSIVREAIVQYCTEKLKASRRTPHDAVAGFIGCFRSGRRDLSARVHEIVRERLIGSRRQGPR